jgi:Acetyltransferase (GNAT) domain
MNHLSLRVTPPGEYREWFEARRAVLRRRSVFHQPLWLDAVGRGSRGDLVCIGAYDAGELVAVLPGFLARRGPFRLFGSPLRGTMTSYLGPVGLASAVSEGQVGELIRACDQFARGQWGVDYTEFTLREAPGGEDLGKLGPGWEPRRPSSYCLDLSRGEAALWQGMRGRCRRWIRKAQRLELMTVPLRDPHRYHEMQEQTFARHGRRAPHPETFLRIVMDLPADLVWSRGTEYAGRLIAGGLFLHDDQEVHYISGATLSAFRSVPGHYPLLWDAITAGVRSGQRVFDFFGRGVPSIDEFKESFGPEVVEYWSLSRAPRHVRVCESVFATSVLGAHALRRLSRRGARTWVPRLLQAGRRR